MNKELVKALWDNKNLMREWDWLFDDGEYIGNWHSDGCGIVLGFINDVPCEMKYKDNNIVITPTSKCTEGLYNEIEQRVNLFKKDVEGLVTEISFRDLSDIVWIQTFFN